MSPPPQIRLLVVNGCSMTYGVELDDRLRTGWAAVLARRLGAQLVNLGAPAGSNHRLIRLTVERIGQYTRDRDMRPDEVLFLGMWTKLNRFEVFTDEKDGQDPLSAEFSDPGWCRIHQSYIHHRHRKSIAWYRDLQNDIGDRSEFMLQWIMFDAWLARTGYHYGYLWAFDPDPQVFGQFPALTEQLDLSRVIGVPRLPYGGPSIFSVGEALKNLGPSLHPLERSHEHFVDAYVHDWVRKLIARPAPAIRSRSPAKLR